MTMITGWVVIFLAALGQIDAQHCFSCSHLAHPWDCDALVKCETYETCFVDQMISISGHIYYNSGCRDRALCRSKRNRNFAHLRNVMVVENDIQLCSECCDDNFCNNHQCDKGVPPSDKGLYCMQCNDVENPSDCEHFGVCGPHEICYVRDFQTIFLEKRYTMGCLDKTNCDFLAAKQERDRCFSCCQGAYCNKFMCSSDTSTNTSERTRSPTKPLNTVLFSSSGSSTLMRFTSASGPITSSTEQKTSRTQTSKITSPNFKPAWNLTTLLKSTWPTQFSATAIPLAMTSSLYKSTLTLLLSATSLHPTTSLPLFPQSKTKTASSLTISPAQKPTPLTSNVYATHTAVASLASLSSQTSISTSVQSQSQSDKAVTMSATHFISKNTVASNTTPMTLAFKSSPPFITFPSTTSRSILKSSNRGASSTTTTIEPSKFTESSSSAIEVSTTLVPGRTPTINSVFTSKIFQTLFTTPSPAGSSTRNYTGKLDSTTEHLRTKHKFNTLPISSSPLRFTTMTSTARTSPYFVPPSTPVVLIPNTKFRIALGFQQNLTEIVPRAVHHSDYYKARSAANTP